PRPVLLEQLALVGAVERVVQRGPDEPSYSTAVERNLGRLLRALELAHDAEVDRHFAQRLAERTCLLDPGRREAAGHGAVAVYDVDHIEHALAVPREDRLLHAAQKRSER